MSEKIKIVAIGGSVRPGNFTQKALNVVGNFLEAHDHVDVVVIDPAQIELAATNQTPGPSVDELKAHVKEATGIILATPEYHGSYSSVIKLVIENLEFPSLLAGKPIALLGVAAGRIGAIKALEHLRSVCSHIGAIVLSGPISIAGVQNYFDEQGHCTDDKTKELIESVGQNLIDFIENHICPKKALEQYVRESH